MVWSKDLPEGNESQKVKYDIVQYTRGKVLDLGCGPWKAFPHFIGVDAKEEWEDTGPWRPDIIDDCQKLSLFAKESIDAVYSSHLLEHFDDTEAVLKEWWRVIKVGGYLVLYLPHKDFYPNIGHEDANKSHKHDFLPEDIIKSMGFAGWDLLVNEDRNKGNEYSFLQVYQKRKDKEQNRKYLKKKPDKTCAVVRYGGIGDMIMVSSLFPALKDQGYHTILHTAPMGEELLKTDPNIDEIIVSDKDQVPNLELFEYFEALRRRHTKFINLSESVEGTLLILPSRPMYYYPQWARDYLYNFNYLDFAHVVAQCEKYPKRPKFYPTQKEKEWAEGQRRAIHGRVVVWTLSGSAVHKMYPWMDRIIARLLLNDPNINIVLVGDEVDQVLETSWENEPRVLRTCGKWGIRQTLTFLEYADLVIGAETGTMNAAAMMQVPKIIFLSHSSVNNLTRDWINTISLTPDNCECYPCHQMHYQFDKFGCHRHDDPNITDEFKKRVDEFKNKPIDQIPEDVARYLGTWTGTALCAALTDPEKVWDAICDCLEGKYDNIRIN